eukprot:Phypoly_transcript_11278.p1 GENE.Phypoly_transcript_11278~~Phypoly_transcript_11278.p1  ORF type:complete len:336 (+),score=60.54 Phypoly_transcript_11278:159-1166(+)
MKPGKEQPSIESILKGVEADVSGWVKLTDLGTLGVGISKIGEQIYKTAKHHSKLVIFRRITDTPNFDVVEYIKSFTEEECQANFLCSKEQALANAGCDSGKFCCQAEFRQRTKFMQSANKGLMFSMAINVAVSLSQMIKIYAVWQNIKDAENLILSSPQERAYIEGELKEMAKYLEQMNEIRKKRIIEEKAHVVTALDNQFNLVSAKFDKHNKHVSQRISEAQVALNGSIIKLNEGANTLRFQAMFGGLQGLAMLAQTIVSWSAAAPVFLGLSILSGTALLGLSAMSFKTAKKIDDKTIKDVQEALIQLAALEIQRVHLEERKIELLELIALGLA